MTRKQKKMLIRIILSAVLLAGVWTAGELLQINRYVQLALYLIPYLVIGYDILKKAVKGIFRAQVFDENFLMAAATVGAVALGEYREAVAVMLFYQIGELFQSCAVGKSRKSISALMDIRPDSANLELDGEITAVDPECVETGSLIVVRAGEKIPIDGIVEQGESTLNTSALTGESRPKNVRCGDEVLSGCINISGVIKIRTTKAFGESTVSKILDLVENSSSKKSKSEKFISKFARYYTPAVCISALVLAIIPPIISLLIGAQAQWGEWIYRALTFLVISCPCALVISIPLTFFAGIGGAGRDGILIKGANYLETLAKTKYVVFDKTGTMTKGNFEVSKIYAADGNNSRLLELTALAESFSTHPISISLQKAYAKEIDKNRVCNVQEISGKGVRAVVDGTEVLVGNAKLMALNNIEYNADEADGTVVYAAFNGEYAGRIIIKDALKENACEAVKAMKKIGIKKTVMLTGDADEPAKKVAEQLSADEYYSSLLPADKVEMVENLLRDKGEKEKLAFVGDGINDAPVLSRADIGIAMGALGSDAAIEAADVVLMDDDPIKITKAIRISQKCLGIVYQNIMFALGIKALCLLLGALGIADMWLAIFADVGVMVIAVLNAIRALSVKKL